MVLRKIRGRIEQFFEKHPKATQVVGKTLHPSSLVRMASAPLMASGVAGHSIAGKVGMFVKTGFRKVTTNPFAGMTFKGALKSGAGRLGSAFGVYSGAQAVRSAITGEPFSPFSRRGALGSFGVAIGGFPALISGSVIGLGEKGIKKGKEIITGTPLPPNIDIVPSPRPEFFDFGALQEQFPSYSGVNMPSPSMGSGVIAPSLSVSPSGSIGGGGLDPTLLALLIGGAGALGFGLGRRRRKRKKAKRKKYKGVLRKK